MTNIKSPPIKQDPRDPMDLEILAGNIKRLANVGEMLKGSRLKQKAVLILLNHMTGVPQRDIRTILDALPMLAKEYLK